MSTIEAAARTTGIIREPVVGLLVMGRKRPGFDPAWGAEVRARIGEAIEELPWHVIVPSENIADDAELSRVIDVCRARSVDVLVLVQPTISDGRLAPLLARFWNRPLVLWATTERRDGEMISANSLVGTHVMAATLRQLGHPMEFVYGAPEEAETRSALRRAVSAVHAATSIRSTKLGLIGYHAPGFVDFHSDPVFLAEQLGAQLYHMSTPELVDMVNAWDDAELEETVASFRSLPVDLTTELPVPLEEALAMQARYYRSFRELFAKDRFDALAFRCWPDLPTLTGHWPYLALARLVSEGFPVAMEGDVDGAICSRIAESAGIGPVYLSDWLEHDRSTITIWHTGAAPIQYARTAPGQGAPAIGVQFNNKKPAVLESTIRSGMEATLFRLWRFEGRYHMTALEGRTIEPRHHLLATNGLFETDDADVREWFDERVQIGMPHHVCLVEGSHRELLRRIARLSGFVWE